MALVRDYFMLRSLYFSPQSHFISALTVVFVNSKSLSSLKIDDTPVDDPSLKVLVANNSDTLKLLKMSSCPHVSPAGDVITIIYRITTHASSSERFDKHDELVCVRLTAGG